MRPAAQPAYSPLHYDVLEFARQVVPTPAERAEKQRVIQSVAAATRRSFDGNPAVRVQPFGSFVNGLSTWDSDVDLVVTGLARPSRVTGGFSHNDKRVVYRALDRIASSLRKTKKLGIHRMVVIRSARIPIIKLEAEGGVVADISLGDGSGPKAASYVAQQLSAYPPLGPLVLVLKVFLRSCGLNEVANGGLSSFSLTNMALAHLMEELKEGRDVYDLGETLYGFLLRFGDEFSIHRDAVAVALGGCVPRSELPHLERNSQGRLLLEDPLTGRDVASGSFRIVAVQAALSRAARRLEALAAARHGAAPGVNYLSGLFDVARALDRGAARGRRGGAGAGLPRGGGGGVAAEYSLIGRGGRYVDSAEEELAELPLDDPDEDELGPEGEEDYGAYLWPEDERGRGGRRRRG